MIAPYMPLEMCASTGLVPQWYMNTPGSLARERVRHRLARLHVDEVDVGRHASCMEVDGVGDRAVVGERDSTLLALADVDHGAGAPFDHVQAVYLTPGAISIVRSVSVSVMSATGPSTTGGKAAG